MPQPLGRHAPPASVTSDGGLAWRWFQPGLAAVGAGVGSFWLAQHALVAGWVDRMATTATAAVPHAALTSPWGLWLALVPAGLCALLVGGLTWRLSAQPPQTLAWNGQCWLLNGEPVAPQARLDLQRWLLLRLQAVGSRRTTWVALSARHASGAAWHGLRAALYSAAPPTSAPPAGGPSP